MSEIDWRHTYYFSKVVKGYDSFSGQPFGHFIKADVEAEAIVRVSIVSMFGDDSTDKSYTLDKVYGPAKTQRGDMVDCLNAALMGQGRLPDRKENSEDTGTFVQDALAVAKSLRFYRAGADYYLIR
jgi:hypothetical protein